jgi:hypothetical protein
VSLPTRLNAGGVVVFLAICRESDHAASNRGPVDDAAPVARAYDAILGAIESVGYDRHFAILRGR